jgi:serine/threonine protein kinase
MFAEANHTLLLKTVPFQHEVLKVLGSGGEGIVYLIQELSSEQKYVVKLFYQPHRRIWSDGLIKYEQQVNAPELGLSPVTLLGNSEEIQAVMYPFTQLHTVHWRLLYYFENCAQALFSSFCTIQYYLMSNHGICLLDPTAENFMMGKEGRFHFIDFGWQIRKIDHPRSVREGKFGYALAMLLLDTYHENIKQTVLPFSDYSYDQPCVYFDIEAWDHIAERQPWVRSILEKLRCSNAASFLCPEFYLELNSGLPDRVAVPWLMPLLGDSMRLARNLFA